MRDIKLDKGNLMVETLFIGGLVSAVVTVPTSVDGIAIYIAASPFRERHDTSMTDVLEVAKRLEIK